MEIISLWRQAEKRKGSYHEGLLKAIGVTPHKKPSVLDATAGLGRDGFLLAAAGCQVMLLERVTSVFELLKQAHQAASQDPALAPIAACMDLREGDARSVIPEIAPSLCFEVIYLDPMYPMRKKSALVKKELRDLKVLVGQDEDAADLLPIALKYALKRVVVKRHRLALPLGEATIHHVIEGKTTRYDVYLPTTN